ncbi:hypothetical protein JL720_5619 [Aureococcus anophagefferens]|nr:hypothetical protein JL720_5619 [Aureococcus anophagefferens]
MSLAMARRILAFLTLASTRAILMSKPESRVKPLKPATTVAAPPHTAAPPAEERAGPLFPPSSRPRTGSLDSAGPLYLSLSALVGQIKACLSREPAAPYSEAMIDEVRTLLARTELNPREWQGFQKHEKARYTRNIVAVDERFVALLLCWDVGQVSAIHDHAGSACWVKLLSGALEEQRYEPEFRDGAWEKLGPADRVACGDATYMDNSLGVHSIANPDESRIAVSLHVYAPAFEDCAIFGAGGEVKRGSMVAALAPEKKGVWRDDLAGLRYRSGGLSLRAFGDTLEQLAVLDDASATDAVVTSLLNRLELTPEEWTEFASGPCFSEFDYTRGTSRTVAVSLHVLSPPMTAQAYETGLTRDVVVHASAPSDGLAAAVARGNNVYTNIPGLVNLIEQEFAVTDSNDRVERLSSLLDNCRLNEAEWQGYAAWNADTFSRVLLAENDAFNLVLVAWERGNYSPVHDHGGSAQWTKILQGSLEEATYALGADGAMHLARTGPMAQDSVTYAHPDTIHGCVCDDRCFSLTLYSPPYTTANAYSDAGDVVTKVEIPTHVLGDRAADEAPLTRPKVSLSADGGGRDPRGTWRVGEGLGAEAGFALWTVCRVRDTMSLEETVVKAAEAAVDAAIEATALSGDAFGERLEAMAAKLSAAARAGVKKARSNLEKMEEPDERGEDDADAPDGPGGGKKKPRRRGGKKKKKVAEANAPRDEAKVGVKKEAEPSPGNFVNFHVKDCLGRLTTFKIENATKLEAVLDTYKRSSTLPLRYIFKGNLISPDQTPQDIDMDDGDTIHLVPNLRGDIGIFGDHAGSPGLAFLQPGATLDNAPAAVVREIAARCRRGGSEGAAPYFASFPAAGLLSAAQRAALRSELDLGAGGVLDFKKPLTRREASSRLGAKVYGSLEALFSSRRRPRSFRRSAPSASRINFHTDVNHKTLQLCLNDFDGGDLVFAADDKVKPRRPPSRSTPTASPGVRPSSAARAAPFSRARAK